MLRNPLERGLFVFYSTCLVNFRLSIFRALNTRLRGNVGENYTDSEKFRVDFIWKLKWCIFVDHLTLTLVTATAGSKGFMTVYITLGKVFFQSVKRTPKMSLKPENWKMVNSCPLSFWPRLSWYGRVMWWNKYAHQLRDRWKLSIKRWLAADWLQTPMVTDRWPI